jgi:hypothetical protein
MENDELFWIDYANELWQCPACDVWVSFRNNQPCPMCNREAPDPVFQWNAKQRKKQTEHGLKFQFRVAFYVLGIVLCVGSVVGLAMGGPVGVALAFGFLGWVIGLRVTKKKAVARL